MEIKMKKLILVLLLISLSFPVLAFAEDKEANDYERLYIETKLQYDYISAHYLNIQQELLVYKTLFEKQKQDNIERMTRDSKTALEAYKKAHPEVK